MLLSSVIKPEKLKDLCDLSLQRKYYDFDSFIDLLDQKKVCIGEVSEFEARKHFREIKRECESRFHVSEFPM